MTAVNEHNFETQLECNHCGDAAIVALDGWFTDGDGGGRCISCGFPGMVSADGESAYWRESDEPSDRCSDPKCEDCGGAP